MANSRLVVQPIQDLRVSRYEDDDGPRSRWSLAFTSTSHNGNETCIWRKNGVCEGGLTKVLDFTLSRDRLFLTGLIVPGRWWHSLCEINSSADRYFELCARDFSRCGFSTVLNGVRIVFCLLFVLVYSALEKIMVLVVRGFLYGVFVPMIVWVLFGCCKKCMDAYYCVCALLSGFLWMQNKLIDLFLESVKYISFLRN